MLSVGLELPVRVAEENADASTEANSILRIAWGVVVEVEHRNLKGVLVRGQGQFATDVGERRESA